MGPLSQPFGSVDTPSLDPNYSFKGEFTKLYNIPVQIGHGVNVFLRKIAVAAASKPAVEITQQGESLSIQTSTSVRTTYVSFTVGESFNETTVDGRPCTSFPKWETDRKITCEQTLQKGEGPETSWTRELTNDGQMILNMRAGDVVCTRVYERD
ncbi:cellular retinoic acid-binding protein 2-like [Sinocyclocheilus grahami]|uniref:cellular retinoic acid-binding protein 2-like n=1 Tax=Sinocyclocheilus grahami TaxID=75366 RepID=UPI0007ACA43C|nr:PREDICTED: cellular retinoic acid-binding protein 2-like [Sinocyclocheilus grahami]